MAEEETPNPNLVAAIESRNKGEELVECPKCGNFRRAFTIVDEQCDSCRAEGQRANIVQTLGWPEVRQRRNLLLRECDATQLPDRLELIRTRFTIWRARLRDVTQEPDPLAAWHKLDELEANRPGE